MANQLNRLSRIKGLSIAALILGAFASTASAECEQQDTQVEGYKEGQVIDLHFDTRHFTGVSGWNHYFQLPIGNITRNCVAGPLVLHFPDWNIPSSIESAMVNNNIADIHVNVKIKKVNRTCKQSADNTSKCDLSGNSGIYGTEGFQDEAEFVSWDPKYASLFKKADEEQDKNHKEDVQREADNEKYAKDMADAPKRCKPFYDKLAKLKARFEKTIPDLQQKYIDSGIGSRVTTTPGEKLQAQRDENTLLNRETAKYQKDVAKLMSSKEAKGCPSLAELEANQ